MRLPGIQLVPAALVAGSSLGAMAKATWPKPVIIDTDIMGDVDDVGALAVANVLHNCGMADVRAVLPNTNSKFSALAASVMNTYFGNGNNIPVASMSPVTDDVYFDDRYWNRNEYASKLAMNWPRALNDSRDAPTPLDLYRRILGEAEDKSITIISVGFFGNLAELLRSSASEDERSDDAQGGGKQLVSSKVKELVVMGGTYPSGHEFNMYYDNPSDTKYVVDNWPPEVPIVWSGYELGTEIWSGFQLPTHSLPDSPILASYQWHIGRGSTVRPSWDPITVLYGILSSVGDEESGWRKLGLRGSPFVYANEYGYNSVDEKSGNNSWVFDEGVTNQHWLRLADGVNNASVSGLLDRFYTHNPMSLECL